MNIIKLKVVKGRNNLESIIPIFIMTLVKTSGITSKISTTVENLFTTHMQRLVQRRHTIPKFKVRHSPFFSPEHFFLQKVPPASDLPVGFIEFNFGAAALEITALRGRGFPCRHSDDDPRECQLINKCYFTCIW